MDEQIFTLWAMFANPRNRWNTGSRKSGFDLLYNQSLPFPKNMDPLGSQLALGPGFPRPLCPLGLPGHPWHPFWSPRTPPIGIGFLLCFVGIFVWCFFFGRGQRRSNKNNDNHPSGWQRAKNGPIGRKIKKHTVKIGKTENTGAL